ncbi:MAG: glycosyltransferase family 39 protein [Pseudomonadota bacterium]
MNSTTKTKRISWLMLLLGMILLTRLISLWFNNSELFFDEAQYWFWAQELDFGYFSKPPLLAWIIASSTAVCGNDGAFCVRLAAPIIHVATAIMIYLSAARLFDEHTAFWSGILYAIMPAVSLSSTIISTDVPLMFCWSFALYAYVRLREEFDVKWALILGISIGLGLNAKYAMVYFVGCALIHMLVEQQEYTPPRKPVFWLAILVAAVMMIPNGIWNFENGFVTALHTGENIGWDGFVANWTGLAEFFGSQFGVFGPIAFGIFLATAFRMWGDTISREHRLLLSFSLPILVLLLGQAIISKAYANWAATTYIAASILVAEVMVNRIPKLWLNSTVALHGLVFAGITIAVCSAGPGQLVLPNGVQPFARTQGATLLADEVKDVWGQYEYNGLVTTDRKLSSLLVYNLRDQDISVHAWRYGEIPRDHFQMSIPFQESLRDPVLVVSRYDNMDAYRAGFKSATNLGHRDIAAGNIKRLYFFRLEGHESFQ